MAEWKKKKKKVRKWKLEIQMAEQRINHNVLWDSAESEMEEAGQNCSLGSGVFSVCVCVCSFQHTRVGSVAA